MGTNNTKYALTRHNLFLEIPQERYNELEKISNMTGIPVASLISLIVTDTLLKHETLIPSKRVNRKVKLRKRIRIGFDDAYFENVIIKFIEKCEKYTLKDLVLDCIELRLSQDFDTMLQLSIPEHSTARGVATAKSKRETKKAKKDSTILSPMEDYIQLKAEQWGIRPEAIRKYYLAKQINELLTQYDSEIRNFSTPNDVRDNTYITIKKC